MTGNHGFHDLAGAGPCTCPRTSSISPATCAAPRPAISRKWSVTLPSWSSASRGLASVKRPSTTSAPPGGGATCPPGRMQLTAKPFSSKIRSSSPRSAAGSSWLPAPSYRATRIGGNEAADGFTRVLLLPQVSGCPRPARTAARTVGPAVPAGRPTIALSRGGFRDRRPVGGPSFNQRLHPLLGGVGPHVRNLDARFRKRRARRVEQPAYRPWITRGDPQLRAVGR